MSRPLPRHKPDKTRFVDTENGWCLRANRLCAHQGALRYFAAASRLGDGMFWYVLMGALIVFDGTAGLRASLHLAATGVQLGDGEHLGLFAAGEFVGLGQNHQKLEAGFHARAHGFEQGFVEFGQAQTRVAQQHDAGEAGAAHEVVEHHALPALLVRARHGRVAVTG